MTRTEQEAHLKKWSESGLSKKAYAFSAGIKYETFIYWFTRERRSNSVSGRFIKLEGGVRTGRIDIKLCNGIVVEFRGDLSIDLLKMLSNV